MRATADDKITPAPCSQPAVCKSGAARPAEDAIRGLLYLSAGYILPVAAPGLHAAGVY